MAAPTQVRLISTAASPAQAAPRFFALLVFAGLLNTLIAAFLFLRLPADDHPTRVSLFIKSAAFVLAGALAGTAGAWLYWRRAPYTFRLAPPIPFSLFAISAAAGWVWIPAIVLLSREDSPKTPVIALIAAAVLALALRRVIPQAPTLPERRAWVSDAPPGQLFAATLQQPRRHAYGYLLALSIYTAAYALQQGEVLAASALVAYCAFAAVWMLTRPPATGSPDADSSQLRRSTRRLALVLLPAVLLTFFALFSGIGHRNQMEAEEASAPHRNGHNQGNTVHADGPATADSGYHSIILWPVPQKHEIQPPLPQPTSFLAPGTTTPLVIHFTGNYWYFQQPAHRPGDSAIQAKGTPLDHDIETNNFIPLTMEAHQALGKPIQLSRVHEIDLGILNRESSPGDIHIALLLSESSAPSNQLYLGQQPVESSASDRSRSLDDAPSLETHPVPETLRFVVPKPASLRRFDQITVMFLPSQGDYNKGPRIALQQFQIVPNA